jgi:hypothetical protein
MKPRVILTGICLCVLNACSSYSLSEKHILLKIDDYFYINGERFKLVKIDQSCIYIHSKIRNGNIKICGKTSIGNGASADYKKKSTDEIIISVSTGEGGYLFP